MGQLRSAEILQLNVVSAYKFDSIIVAQDRIKSNTLITNHLTLDNILFKFGLSRIFVTSYCLIGIFSCSGEYPADPVCRVNSQYQESIQANAGCLIRVGNQLVTIGHRLSGKLDIPGGTQTGDESAQCTAHRETWQETGFNVEVGQLLGVQENGFRFYQCTLAGDFTGEIKQFPVPDWASTEVTAIELKDPFVTRDTDWRYPDELVEIRGMFNQIEP